MSQPTSIKYVLCDRDNEKAYPMKGLNLRLLFKRGIGPKQIEHLVEHGWCVSNCERYTLESIN